MRNGFASELARFGPDSPFQSIDGPRARRYCQRLTENHYENFSVASLLLPRRLRPHFHAIYAYCRWADDLADETGNATESLRLLAWWRDELKRCYADEPTHPVMVALHPTIRRFRIPVKPFLDLLDAFEQDQHINRYETYDLLIDYCTRSANPVGRLVLYLCECHDSINAALSDHICTALQLTNFWQDVARDFALGRVYLPRADRASFGYSEHDLNACRFTPAFAELLRFEVQRARELFLQGLPLVERLPADIRVDIELFARGGLAILRKIEEAGYNVWQDRPVLAKWEKAALLGKAWLRQLAVQWS
jgi:squalene synthase HpnC